MATETRPNASRTLTDSQADPVPQFFISLVNRSDSMLELISLEASSGCGWVQEPYVGEKVAAGDERVWCGMPWDMDSAIDLRLQLRASSGETLQITLSRPPHAGAQARVQLDGGTQLDAQMELQRADSTSPFVMVWVQPR